MDVWVLGFRVCGKRPFAGSCCAQGIRVLVGSSVAVLSVVHGTC